MRKLTDLLLRFAARDIQSLLDFIGRIDARLDAYIAERDAEIADINNQIATLQTRKNGVVAAASLATGLQAGVQNLRG